MDPMSLVGTELDLHFEYDEARRVFSARETRNRVRLIYLVDWTIPQAYRPRRHVENDFRCRVRQVIGDCTPGRSFYRFGVEILGPVY